ncbi:alpha/beta fold hydrolase [Patescibacteria group bacterium]|nr:alpha/beta fold hydrolase [Patescibacteria group bacterium]
MKKRAYIIHGWDGKPNSNWFPWLKQELEKNDFDVILPQMPDPEVPTIEKWVGYLDKLVKNPDENTYLIGHSMGCQAIIRYLEKINTKIGGIILVAGFFTLTNLETQEEQNIAKPWLETLINFKKVKNSTNHIISLFSDNDPYVPAENFDLFKNNLKAEVIVKKNAGHFNESDGFTKLPLVLKKVLKISK